MSFDVAALTNALAAHNRVARVVVARTEGSTPREVGASMLVWGTGSSGTIGGGALEFDAISAAQKFLRVGKTRSVNRVPLGPSLGQCCGGAVTLITESFDSEALKDIVINELFARPTGQNTTMPLSVSRVLNDMRGKGILPMPGLVDGWMIEPTSPLTSPLWIYGAGHVGRALVNVITPLSEFVITWIDTGPERFPEAAPKGITILPAAEPQRIVTHAPANAHHLILTYSHALDLELCHAVLNHRFASVGLIGSDTKWARFQKRLSTLGHAPDAINQIICPIGDKTLGKHPHALALGVATSLLRQVAHQKSSIREMPRDREIDSG